MKFTIVRKNWAHGFNEDHVDNTGVAGLCYTSGGRSDEPRQCCLGFLANACGYTRHELVNHVAPDQLTLNLFPATILETSYLGNFRHTRLTDNLISVNDASMVSAAAREREITKLFAQGGIDVGFVD